MQRGVAHLALAFGLFLAVAEAVRNWGDWQWWPFWVVDYVAAALLTAGALLTLRRAPQGPVLLVGAWGFSTAMFYMSFWSHVAQFDQPADGNIPQAPLTIAIGGLWVVSVAGFALSLFCARRPPA